LSLTVNIILLLLLVYKYQIFSFILMVFIVSTAWNYAFSLLYWM